MKRFTLLFLVSILLFSSCSYYKKLNIESASLASVQMKSASKVLLGFKLRVDNPSDVAISLVGMDGSILRLGEAFATFSLLDTAVVAPISNEEVLVTAEVLIKDPRSLLMLGLDLKNWNWEDFAVDGVLKLDAQPGVAKKLKLKKIPLEQLVKNVKL